MSHPMQGRIAYLRAQGHSAHLIAKKLALPKEDVLSSLAELEQPDRREIGLLEEIERLSARLDLMTRPPELSELEQLRGKVVALERELGHAKDTIARIQARRLAPTPADVKLSIKTRELADANEELLLKLERAATGYAEELARERQANEALRAFLEAQLKAADDPEGIWSPWMTKRALCVELEADDRAIGKMVQGEGFRGVKVQHRAATPSDRHLGLVKVLTQRLYRYTRTKD